MNIISRTSLHKLTTKSRQIRTCGKLCVRLCKSMSGNMSARALSEHKPILGIVSVFSNVSKEIRDSEYSDCFSSIFQIPNENASLEMLKDADIIIGDPPTLAPFLFQLPKLKWFSSTFAGVDDLFKNTPSDKKTPSFIITRHVGAFGPLMAEYVIGHILARERKFELSWKCQKEKVWLPYPNYVSRLLSELTIGIIGVGVIGKTIAEKCKLLGMTVNTVHREVPSEKLPFVDNCFALSDISECLKQCDYFCNILPTTSATTGLLSGNVFESCKTKKTVFINIGRGQVTDEETILNALSNNWLGGAILDVFETEPLPTSSLLWEHPGVTITTHISGLTRNDDICGVFLENFEFYKSGKPLKYAVDWQKGY